MPKVSKPGRQQPVVTTKLRVTKADAKKIDAGKKSNEGNNPVKLKSQPDRDKVELSKKEKSGKTSQNPKAKKPVAKEAAPKRAKEVKTDAKVAPRKPAVSAPAIVPSASEPITSCSPKVAPTDMPTVAPPDISTLPPSSGENGVKVAEVKGKPENGIMIDPSAPKAPVAEKVLPPAPQRLFPQDPLKAAFIEDGIVATPDTKASAGFLPPPPPPFKVTGNIPSIEKPKTFAQVANGEVDRVAKATKGLVRMVDESTTLKSVVGTAQRVLVEGRGLLNAMLGVKEATGTAGKNIVTGAIRALFRR